MLTRETLLLAAEAMSKQSSAAAEAGDVDRAICYLNAAHEIRAEIDGQHYYIVDELERGLVNVAPVIRIDGRSVA